jgi:hypothetical protein
MQHYYLAIIQVLGKKRMCRVSSISALVDSTREHQGPESLSLPTSSNQNVNVKINGTLFSPGFARL